MADRTCPGCGINDNHPRHILVGEEGNQWCWHTDCHAAKGCPICAIKREGAEGVIGDEYRQHLLDNADELAARISELSQEQLDAAHGVGV